MVRQVVDQTYIADGGSGSGPAKEADVRLIAADGEVADAAAVAVKDGGKGIVFVADRQPTADAILIDRKINGLGVTPIKAEPLVATARPSAAILVAIKVQVLHELIAKAKASVLLSLIPIATC